MALLLQPIMANGKGSLTTAAEVLGRAAGRLRIDESLRLYRLWDLWHEIAGETLSQHARPARWQGRNLIVRVEHAAWIQELGFLKHEIKGRIDAAFPEAKVKSIRFEVGKLPDAPKGATKAMPSAARELTADEIEFIEQAAGEIADEETREAARRAMIRGFQYR